MHVSLLEDSQACLLTDILLDSVSVTEDVEIPPTFLGSWIKICDAWAPRWNSTAPSSSAKSTFYGPSEVGSISVLWDLMWWLFSGEKLIYIMTSSWSEHLVSEHQVNQADRAINPIS